MQFFLLETESIFLKNSTPCHLYLKADLFYNTTYGNTLWIVRGLSSNTALGKCPVSA